MSKFNKIFFYPSSLVLILVNLIPLLGVLFFSWDIFTVIILYWMESAVIGFFNILKMQKINNYKFTPLVPFFIMHYVIFMFVHLFFILQLFQPNLELASGQVAAFVIVFEYFKALIISLSFIFLSHGMSFVFNFIKKQEFKYVSLKKQMFVPYRRIIIMHIIIMLAGAGIIYTNYSQEVSAVVFLVILKIIFDLGSHIFEHRKNILN
ncbi:MAG: hypothetical protein HOC78_00400 [Candidatus Komeilibacteria bacterium]|jgi:hypothetical protein|nr:hypothetical protein [Candidatus Komeilibacteria bacterium]